MVPARRLNPLASWLTIPSVQSIPEGTHPSQARPWVHIHASPCPALTPLPRDRRRGPAPGRRETRPSTFPLGS